MDLCRGIRAQYAWFVEASKYNAAYTDGGGGMVVGQVNMGRNGAGMGSFVWGHIHSAAAQLI